MNLASLFAAGVTVIGLASSTMTVVNVPAHCVTLVRTIEQRSSGPDVAALQTFLGLKPTAYFGLVTKLSLTKWQLTNHLIISATSLGAGKVGPKTRAALRCQNTTNTSTSTVPIVTTVGSAGVLVVKATTTPIRSPAPTPILPANGGGGSGIQQPAATSHCVPFTNPKPPASQCTTGSWQVINDEADCPVEWDCSNPNATE